MKLATSTELKTSSDKFLKVNEHINTGMLIKADNYDRIKGEFGLVFTDAALSFILTRLVEMFDGFDADICRVSGSTFFILWKNTDTLEALKHVETIEEVFRTGYIGELNSKILTATCKAGIASGKFDSFSGYYDRAVRALDKILKTDAKTSVYNEQTDGIVLKHNNIRNYVSDECVAQDHEFISMAAKLITHSINFESTINLVIQMAGKRYGLSSVALCEYEVETGAMHLKNMWTEKRDIVNVENTPALYDNWSNFEDCFDRNGFLAIVGGSSKHLSEEAKEFCRRNHINSTITCLMYNNNHIIGSITYSDNDRVRMWSKYEMASMYELAKIISMFLARNQNNNATNAMQQMTSDPLTGLMNLDMFVQRGHKTYLEKGNDMKCVVSFSDINNFAYINENFGFSHGDRALTLFADKLKNTGLMCCRKAGDRFLTMGIHKNVDEAVEILSRLNTEMNSILKKKFPVSDVGVSTGICVLDPLVDDIRNGIEKANIVRKLVKEDRKKTYALYTDEINEKKKRELAIIGGIHSAIASGEIEAFLQPKYSLSQNCIIGAEALVRWRRQDGTYISPADFVPVLERVGYIVDVDYCVYEQVLKRCAKWQSEGKELIPISVNFSRKHTGNPDFVKNVCGMAEKYGVDKRYIELEITESTISDNSVMMRNMEQLRGHGFKLNMDDFGTGYSSLDLLIDAPVDIVKIDKRFIDRSDSETGRMYIKQIANLVLAAGKDIIFEGVETQNQADFLLRNGYSKIQGYFFDRAIPIDEFESKYIRTISTTA